MLWTVEVSLKLSKLAYLFQGTVMIEMGVCGVGVGASSRVGFAHGARHIEHRLPIRARYASQNDGVRDF